MIDKLTELTEIKAKYEYLHSLISYVGTIEGDIGIGLLRKFNKDHDELLRRIRSINADREVLK